MTRYVVCELGRVDELSDELVAAGVPLDSERVRLLTAGPIPAEWSIEWIGLPPSPDGRTFDLRAPIEGPDSPPEWVRYWHEGTKSWAGWNYTRDLVLFRIDGGN